MKNIDRIISEYNAAVEKINALKKITEQAKQAIIDYAGKNNCVITDEFTVIVKRTESVRLNTKELYKDFPDIKKDYGKVTVSTTIDIAKNAEKKTA